MLNKKKCVLVTGATGAVGPRVVHALEQAGFRIRTFSFDDLKEGMFPQDVEVLLGDVTDRVAVESAMQDVDGVIHLAALLHIVNPPPEIREKYERVNVGGTATVVEAAMKAGVKRLVLFSTIAVYGPSNGQILTEDSRPHPDTFYARTKLASERIVLEAKDGDGEPIGSVLRLGAVYGSRIKGNYQRLMESLAKHRFIPVGNGSNRRTLVYDQDVARTAVLALEHPAAGGKIFNVSDGQFHTLKEIIESICSALGRNPPRLSLPLGPIRKLIGLIEKGSHAIGLKPPVTKAIIDKYTEDIAVDGSLIQSELGFEPKFDLLAGWKDTVQEMRKQACLSQDLQGGQS